MKEPITTRPNGRIPQTPHDHMRTRAAHAGHGGEQPVWPLSDPIAVSTVYASHDPATVEFRASADPPEPNYARDGLPNVRALERAVAELEGAEDAHAVASGMAAMGQTLLALLRAGDHVVATGDGYCETRAVLTEDLPRFGVTTTLVATSSPDAILTAVQPSTRMIVIETIANPSLRLADVEAIADGAHRAGVLVCVDNTFATPMLCRPLELGADLVWHSATKFLGGHHDLVAGVVAGRGDLIAAVRQQSQRWGMTLGAMDAWLALRGLHTLAPRMAWISETAAVIAEFLDTHPAVTDVRYPGLPHHPDALLARRLLPDGAGGILTCSLRDGPAAAATLIRALRLIPYALSLGGTSTTVCYPPAIASNSEGDLGSHYAPSATLRLSIGLEAPDDLVADLEQALAFVPLANAAHLAPPERA